MSSTLSTTGPAFSDNGKTFSLTITGVSYGGGAVATTGPPTNRVARVVVTHVSNGVLVTVSLNQTSSNDHITVGRNQITIALS